MVIGKIFYDNTMRRPDEWEEELFSLSKGFSDLKMPYLGDLPGLEQGIQSHYFAILSNNPKKLVSWIRSQAREKTGLSPIVWDATLDSRKNCEFYRFDVPKKIEIFRKPIYDVQSRWIKDKEIHTFSPKQIRNFMDKLESGEI